MRLGKFKFYIVYLIGALLVLPFFFGGHSYAADDIMSWLFRPAKNQGMIINIGENVNTVGNNVFKGSFQISEKGIGRKPSLIVNITQLLLKLTIALSVTMILYNGLSYIIQTGQGKEGKSLVKNVMLIVIGILVSLFSVVIITLIQSVLTTLEKGDKTSTTTTKALNIQYTPINKKSHYDVGDILTGGIRIRAHSGSFENCKVEYYVPQSLEYSSFAIKNNTNGLVINGPDGPNSGEGGKNIYTWDLGGTLKEGTENALVLEIGTIVKEVSESDDDYKNEVCVWYGGNAACDGDKDTTPVEGKYDIGNLSDENRDRLKQQFGDDFDRTKYNKEQLKDNLEKAAKKYFEDRGNKPYKDEETGEYMVSLRGVESYMINAYLSEIWE